MAASSCNLQQVADLRGHQTGSGCIIITGRPAGALCSARAQARAQAQAPSSSRPLSTSSRTSPMALAVVGWCCCVNFTTQICILQTVGKQASARFAKFTPFGSRWRGINSKLRPDGGHCLARPSVGRSVGPPVETGSRSSSRTASAAQSGSRSVGRSSSSPSPWFLAFPSSSWSSAGAIRTRRRWHD